MEAQHLWLGFGVLCSLLPGYLLVRSVMHILNINSPQRWRSLR